MKKEGWRCCRACDRITVRAWLKRRGAPERSRPRLLTHLPEPRTVTTPPYTALPGGALSPCGSYPHLGPTLTSSQSGIFKKGFERVTVVLGGICLGELGTPGGGNTPPGVPGLKGSPRSQRWSTGGIYFGGESFSVAERRLALSHHKTLCSGQRITI
jgi:hypothetical protein